MGLTNEGKCGAAITVPLPDGTWRRALAKSVELRLRPEDVALIKSALQEMLALFPNDCLGHDELWSDHSERFPHRWSAVRSLSVMHPSAIEQMLTNLLRDSDPKVVEQANHYILTKRNQLRWTDGEPAKLLAFTQMLLIEDGSDRSLNPTSLPENIAGKRIKSAELYEKILIIRLLDHNGGIIVNPTGKHEFPAMAVNRRLASPTEYPGVFEFVAVSE